MIDEDFCEFLEFELTKAFRSFGDELTKGFWCDGILYCEPREVIYSKKYINDHRQTKFRAFIGKDGQTEFELILKFGKKALSKFARNLDIHKCLKGLGNGDRLFIDLIEKRIIAQLT